MTFYASFSLKNSMKILWKCRKYDCSKYQKGFRPKVGSSLLTYWGACSVQQLIVVGPIPTTIKCALRWSFTTRLPIRQRKLSWKIPWERRPNSWQGAAIHKTSKRLRSHQPTLIVCFLSESPCNFYVGTVLPLRQVSSYARSIIRVIPITSYICTF